MEHERDGDPRPATGGLFDSARRLLATLLAIAQTRLELVTTEVEEELNRLASMLLWALIAIFFAGLAVLAFGALLVIALWDQYRLLAAGGVALAFVLVAAVAVWRVRAHLHSRPRLLAATLAELERDRAALGGER